jgi:integrase
VSFNGDNLRNRVFYDLLEKVDIPKIRFHDIRHTFASMLLQNGEPLHYVKEQMGHASIQTTVDVYGLGAYTNTSAGSRSAAKPAGARKGFDRISGGYGEKA